MSDGFNWASLQSEAAAGDPAAIKSELDLVAVCFEYGVELTEERDGRWVGLCPFHSDTTPSFAVFGEGVDQKCGCWSCDFSSGDVFDFIRRMENCSFGEALRKARQLQNGGLESPERSYTGARASTVDLERDYRDARERISQGNLVLLQTLLSERGIHAPAAWLAEEFRLGEDGDGGIVIPHFSEDGEVTAIKTRRAPQWTQIAKGGSRLDALYGVWRDRGRPTVVVVEGESDTWTVAWLLRDQDVDVVGLPAGAKPPTPEWLDRLRGRRVILLFDADDAGRIALRKWAGRLDNMYGAILREGEDASSARPENVLRAIERAVPLEADAAPGLMLNAAGGYTRAGGDTVVSDFHVNLVRFIELEGEEVAFDVRLPNGRMAQLLSRDFASETSMRRWANPHGYVWYGTARDAQELMRILMNEAPFVERATGTHTVGWHDDRYVLPDRVIGGKGWAYVPPPNDVGIGSKIRIAPGEWDRTVPRTLARLHRDDVITPIVGWTAAAPLRGTLPQFPILGVVGGAGYGKTTLVREVLRTFGYDVSLTVTQTTPHAVFSFASSTNSVPIWFDEYREGARRDAKQALEQVIRDAWDGASSVKGGMQEQRQALTFLPATAPLVVTGEDSFSETSHAERMAMIQMPAKGRNAFALGELLNSQREGFGYAYIVWLLDAAQRDVLPAAPTLYDRSEQARAIVEWGWELLRAFCREVIGYDLQDFDDTLIRREHEAAASRPVIIEALSVARDRLGRDGLPFVWTEGVDVLVKVQDLVQFTRQQTDIQLPGNARAVQRWLEDKYGATTERSGVGLYLRLPGAIVDVR